MLSFKLFNLEKVSPAPSFNSATNKCSCSFPATERCNNSSSIISQGHHTCSTPSLSWWRSRVKEGRPRSPFPPSSQESVMGPLTLGSSLAVGSWTFSFSVESGKRTSAASLNSRPFTRDGDFSKTTKRCHQPNSAAQHRHRSREHAVSLGGVIRVLIVGESWVLDSDESRHSRS